VRFHINTTWTGAVEAEGLPVHCVPTGHSVELPLQHERAVIEELIQGVETRDEAASQADIDDWAGRSRPFGYAPGRVRVGMGHGGAGWRSAPESAEQLGLTCGGLTIPGRH
jgi:hypothetical protein